MKITDMTVSHVAQVARLEQICFGTEAWSEKSVAGELDNKLSLWLVALDGDAVAGYVGSQTVLDETDMMNVAVHPDFRRQGIARQLIDELVQRLKAAGSRCLTLEVRASNAGAIALYENLGFQEVGRRPRYYRNPREDALILRKEWEV